MRGNAEVSRWLRYEGETPLLTPDAMERATLYCCGTVGPGPSGVVEDFLSQRVLMCPLVETKHYTLGTNYGRESLFGQHVTKERLAYETTDGVPVFSRSFLLDNGALVVSQTSGVFIAGARAETKVSIAEPSNNFEFRTLDVIYLELDCRFCSRRREPCTCPPQLRARTVPKTEMEAFIDSASSWDVMLKFIAANCGGWGWVVPANENRRLLRMQNSMVSDGESHRNLQIQVVQQLLVTHTPLNFASTKKERGSASGRLLTASEEGSLERESEAVSGEDVYGTVFADPSTSDSGSLTGRGEDGFAEASYETAKVTDKQKNTCHICNRAFSRPYDMKRHLTNVHIGERTYSCRLCNKRFAQRGHLNVHVKGVHGERNSYDCKICKKKFSWRHNHKRHMERVHNQIVPDEGEDPSQCTDFSPRDTFPPLYSSKGEWHGIETSETDAKSGGICRPMRTPLLL